MIEELTKKNLNCLENSLLSKDIVLNEMSSNPYAHFLVLLEENHVIGYLYYSDIYDRAEINQFEIEKSFQNQGKGDSLIKEFLKRIDKDVTLEVRKDNTSAIHVYEKNGFVTQAVRKGYYQGVDGLLMERKKK